MTIRSKNIIISVILLLVLGFIWGSGYSIARFVMLHGVPPLGYSFWQSLGPALALLLVCLYQERSFFLSWHHLRYYFITGLTGIAISNANMYFVAPHLPSGIVAVLVSTASIMTYPMAFLVRQELFNYGRMFGVLIGIIGVMMIVGSKASLPTLSMMRWALLTLVTPFLFAASALYIVHDRPKKTSLLMLSAGMLCASVILLAPLVFSMHKFYPLNSFSLPHLAVVLEIILSSIGYIIVFELLKRMGAVFYSLIGGVVTVTGLFWGWIIFDEHLRLWTASAVILIIVAIYTVTLLDKTQQPLRSI